MAEVAVRCSEGVKYASCGDAGASATIRNTKYHAIIFDFDGTLYDFSALARRLILSSPPDALRMQCERKVRRAMLGSDMGSMASLRHELFRRMSVITGKKQEIIEKWYIERYLPLLLKVLKKHYSARNNADCLLESLRVMGIKTAVLSDYPDIQGRLDSIGLDKGLFDATLSAEEIGALKPCARPFLETARVLGVNPRECLVVGDRSDTDGDGARACNMDFIRIVTDKTILQKGSGKHKSDNKSKDAENDIPVLWDDFSRYVLLSV